MRDAANIEERYWRPFEKCYRPGAWEALDSRYRESHRAYHSWRHIHEIFERFEEFSGVSSRPDIVVAATFWHDAVYTVRDENGRRRKDSENVRDSVELFRRHTFLRPEDADAVDELIMGTADHLRATPSHEHYPGFSGDFDLFLDLDLGSLASPWRRFKSNFEDIRFEFSMVPDAEFYRGQIAALSGFAERKSLLFRRPETRKKWSRRAATNLARCIQELRGLLDGADAGARPLVG